MLDDDFFLARTIALAHRGSQAGDGGPFGAVIVRDGQILAECWNRVIIDHDPTAHAEIGAIRAACREVRHFHLTGCTLYASSEPCPMCLAAAYWARIERIVFANPRACAAAVGFCDDDLYQELLRPLAQRQITIEHRPLPDAEQPLEQWAAKPGRTTY